MVAQWIIAASSQMAGLARIPLERLPRSVLNCARLQSQTLWTHCVIRDFSKLFSENLVPEAQNLVRLKVRGLSGRFDYDLPITRVDSPTAILTAPSGYGKTHLLHIIDAIAR